MWQSRLFKAMGRLAAPQATLATWTAARAVRDGLVSAGFTVRREAGIGGKRDITLAHYAPVFTPRRAASRRAPDATREKRALIVGAGLAGCAAAWALAERGWRCALFDAHGAVAQAASGNPAGLFHGIVNPQDGAHARFNRAAAIEAERAVRCAIEQHAVRGSVAGLLRLQTSPSEVAAMLVRLAASGLPADYVQALTASQASLLCGIAVRHPAWFYPGGGWVDPAGLARAFLERAGNSARFVGGVRVERLRRDGSGWELLDTQGRVIDSAKTVLLANAGDALRLLGAPGWSVRRVRGQISMLPGSIAPQVRLPVAGAGYLLPASNDRVLFGATAQFDDDDGTVRASDHARNLAQLAMLTGSETDVEAAACEGRTDWRWASSDRLPIIGAVPDTAPICAPFRAAAARRLDLPRHLPRADGLFVFIALGSRGITWSALGAQVLASCISGAPVPLEASLLDAIDPARFDVRAARRAASRC
jgi:tRNA 5-methylaminomethyl-2-thiouridine biosynthesis bifunctional protein